MKRLAGLPQSQKKPKKKNLGHMCKNALIKEVYYH